MGNNIKIALKIVLIASLSLTQLFSNDDDDDDEGEMIYPNGIAAIIDNRVITMDELNRKIAPYIRQVQREARNPEDFEQRMEAISKEVLDSMINDILIVNEFKSNKKLKIPGSILENHFSKFMGEQFQNNRSQYHQFLEENGTTDRQLKEQQKEQMIIDNKKYHIRKTIAETSPGQMKEYYDENKDRFMQNDSIHLRQIVLRSIDEDTPESTLLLSKGQNILDKLKKGEKFADLAKEYSEDDMRASGGDWGWINRNDIREELAKVAFSLNKNQFSDVILLNNYAFILFVEDKKNAGAIPIEECRKDIEKTLVNKSIKKAEEQHIKKLRRKAYIKYCI